MQITINGQPLAVEPGTTILEAAKQLGLRLPTLCYDPDLRLAGSCRMCVVEVAGRRNLIAACVTPCEEGMEILTESADVVKARKMILDLLLARHEGNCMTCEKTSECRLQEYAYQYGVSDARFTDGGHEHLQITDNNPFIIRDYDKCVMCTRCVRACEEITVARAINVKNRGHHAKIATAFDGDLAESPCVFCGQCIMVCPTGALTSRLSQGMGRAFDVDRVLTTCTYCGTGCTFELEVKDNQIVGVHSLNDEALSPVNKGALCVKGRFGWDFVNSPDRLTTPLIRVDGELKPATWDEALDYAAERLKTIREVNGPDATAVFASARITNEENYLIQKVARAVLGTNNVDHCARL